MIRIIGLLVLVFFVGNAFTQSISQSNVPAVVLNAFQLKLPNANDVKWELEKENYNVNCKVNNKRNTLTLDYKGNILKYDKDLYISEIPKEVLETIRSTVSYFDVNDADRIMENGKVTYTINFKIDGKMHYFWINEKGKMLKYRKMLKESEIPASIVSQISTNYGSYDIESAKYVKEGHNIMYILKGEINSNYHLFKFSDKMDILYHSQDLMDSEIPVPILNAVKKTYPDYDIRDADLLEEGKNVNYKLRLRKSKENIYIYFSTEGKILKVK